LTFLYSWWSDSSLTVYSDPKDIKDLQHEYAISLVNHRYEIDWLLGLVIAQRMGILGVSFRFFVELTCFIKENIVSTFS